MHKRKAQGAGEWGVVVLLVTVVCMVTVLLFAPQMSGILKSITVALDKGLGIQQQIEN